jgi:uncharacterized protein (DUF736 family)
MPQIGEFTRQKSGFSGRIRTFTLDSEIAIVAVDAAGVENAPDHRVHLGSDATGPEVGAAWSRTGEKAGDYLSVLIDDPALPQPMRAALFQNGADASSWSLHWSRAPKRDAKD